MPTTTTTNKDYYATLGVKKTAHNGEDFGGGRLAAALKRSLSERPDPERSAA